MCENCKCETQNEKVEQTDVWIESCDCGCDDECTESECECKETEK